MSKFAALLTALVITGCASYDDLGTISLDAVPKIGKITEKETSINRIIEHNPFYHGSFGYGRYRHHGPWGYDPFFNAGYSTSVRDNVFYQYKIIVDKTEKMTLQSQYNLDVGQCVTIWQIPNSNQYPRVERNPNCQLPEAKVETKAKVKK